MTTETRTQIDVAEHIRSLVGYSKKEVKALADAFVETLAPEDVPLVAVNAAKHAEGAKAVQTACEVRLIASEWEQGRQWADERLGGEVYVFAGAPGELEVADPDALVDALAKAGVPQDEIHRACFKVWKVSHVALSEIAKRRPEWREVVDDHRTRRKSGPPHLVVKEA